MEKNEEKKLNNNYDDRINRLVEDFEKHIHSNINKEYVRSTTWSDKLADNIAKFGGSWRFIIIFFAFLIMWIVLNSLSFTKAIHFDEPPFILLNLVLSFLAGFQAPIIMMSQNRQSERDKEETIIDFAINYKAEKEVDDLQGHLHRIEKDFADFRTEFRENLDEIKRLIVEGKVVD